MFINPSHRRKGRRLWVKGAVKKPGALRRQLRIPAGKKIPLKMLRSAAHAPGKLGQRARMALTLRKFSDKKKKTNPKKGTNMAYKRRNAKAKAKAKPRKARAQYGPVYDPTRAGIGGRRKKAAAVSYGPTHRPRLAGTGRAWSGGRKKRKKAASRRAGVTVKQLAAARRAIKRARSGSNKRALAYARRYKMKSNPKRRRRRRRAAAAAPRRRRRRLANPRPRRRRRRRNQATTVMASNPRRRRRRRRSNPRGRRGRNIPRNAKGQYVSTKGRRRRKRRGVSSRGRRVTVKGLRRARRMIKRTRRGYATAGAKRYRTRYKMRSNPRRRRSRRRRRNPNTLRGLFNTVKAGVKSALPIVGGFYLAKVLGTQINRHVGFFNRPGQAGVGWGYVAGAAGTMALLGLAGAKIPVLKKYQTQLIVGAGVGVVEALARKFFGQQLAELLEGAPSAASLAAARPTTGEYLAYTSPGEYLATGEYLSTGADVFAELGVDVQAELGADVQAELAGEAYAELAALEGGAPGGVKRGPVAEPGRLAVFQNPPSADTYRSPESWSQGSRGGLANGGLLGGGLDSYRQGMFRKGPFEW